MYDDFAIPACVIPDSACGQAHAVSATTNAAIAEVVFTPALYLECRKSSTIVGGIRPVPSSIPAP
jgi:hypothetical protein